MTAGGCNAGSAAWTGKLSERVRVGYQKLRAIVGMLDSPSLVKLAENARVKQGVRLHIRANSDSDMIVGVSSCSV